MQNKMSIESMLWTSISQPASQTQPIAGYFLRLRLWVLPREKSRPMWDFWNTKMVVQLFQPQWKPVSGKVTTDVRLMKHKNGYRTVMVRSQAFVLCRTKWVSKAYFGQVFHSLRRRRSLSRATHLSATQALSTTSGKVTTGDVRLLKHKNG